MTTASVLPEIESDMDDFAALRSGSGTGVTDVRTELSQWATNSDSFHSVIPYLVPNIMNETRDDPFVVSDDNPAKKVGSLRINRLNAIHSQLAPEFVRTGAHENLFTLIDAAVSVRDRQVGYYDAILSTLELETRNRKAALVESIASKATSSAWNSFWGIWDNFSKATPEESLMRKIRAALEPVFREANFQATSTYKDGIGGLVVDFLNAEQRVTIILEEDRLQILYVEDDESTSTVFDNAHIRLAEVYSFVRSKFA